MTTYDSQETSRQSGNVVELYQFQVARVAQPSVYVAPDGGSGGIGLFENHSFGVFSGSLSPRPDLGASGSVQWSGPIGFTAGTVYVLANFALDPTHTYRVVSTRSLVVQVSSFGDPDHLGETIPDATTTAGLMIADYLSLPSGSGVSDGVVATFTSATDQLQVISDGRAGVQLRLGIFALPVDTTYPIFVFGGSAYIQDMGATSGGGEDDPEAPLVLNYTSCDSEIIYNGDTYTPAIFTRLSPFTAGSGERRGSEIEVSLPRDHAIAQLVRDGAPRTPITCTVYRVHRDTLTDAAVPLIGAVRKARYEGPACIVTLGSIHANLQQKLPQLITQRTCPHVLYGPRCQLDKTLFTHTGLEVTAVAGVGVTVSGAAAAATGNGSFTGDTAHYYDEGVLEVADGRQAYIVSSDGDVLTLKAPITGLSDGDTVTLFAGCRHTGADCIARGNDANYGGEAAMPIRDPFDGRGGGLTKATVD